MSRLAHDGLPWPPQWKVAPGEVYPDVGSPIRSIPGQDQKYLNLNLEVLDQRPRESDYDQDQVEVLRRIRAELDQSGP
jgi:hypothetical protein